MNSVVIGEPVELYAVLRRGGWRSCERLELALRRAACVADEQMPDDVRWIRSYVLDEGRGAAGTVCIYQAISPEALRRHAMRARLPVDEIVAVTGTLVVRDDPQTMAGRLSEGITQATQSQRRNDESDVG